MTLEEALIEVYEATDEQSDLNIYDGTGSVSMNMTGSKRIAELLRRAQNAISVWKFPSGRRLRFRIGTKSIVKMATPIDFEFAPLGPTTLQVVGAQDPAQLPDISTIFIDGAAYPVLAWAGGIVTLAIPHGLTGTIVAPWATQYVDLGVNDLIGVIGVYDTVDRFALGRGSDYDNFTDGAFAQGTPASYTPTASGFVLDVCPSDARTYIVRYQRYPKFPQALSDSFELPVSTHDAICEYAKYTANLRIGKSEAAQMAWSKTLSLLSSIRLEADMEEDFVEREVEVTKWQ